MTNISGFVTDVGMVGSHGRLIVQAVEFSGDGDEVLVPSPVSFPIAAGVVSANVSPGAARLTIHVGSSRRDWFVNVPESDVGLGDLIETFTEYEPPVVSAAIAARDAARQARDEAVAAAGDVDSAIAGAADQVVQAVESDRVAAESAAAAASGSASAAGVSAGDASAAAGAAAQSASGAAGSASGAASSAGAASGSATSAAGSATAAQAARTGAETARTQAQTARTGAETARTGAETARDVAQGHAGRAEAAANEFDLTATSSTLAPGAAATVAVSGDGPAYSLAFGVPQGAKGDKGDVGPQGVQGPKGDKGDIGPQGAQGVQGPKGDKGDIGPQGVKGDTGDIGPKGDKGLPGAQEVAWTDAGRPYLLDEVEAGAGGSGALTGAGRPDIPSTTGGVIQGNEPVGALFTSTDGAGVGAWVWVKGTSSWTVTSGDTGWRNVTSTLEANGAVSVSGRLRIKRTAGLVWVSADDLQAASGTVVLIPDSQFLMDADNATYPGALYNLAGDRMQRLDTAQLRFAVTGAGCRLRDLRSYPCSRVWPSTLPGTAV